jgi:glycosyltransferase involved in cell wall biosynthesis
MRILICNYEYPPLGGGGGVICASLAGELARRHDVTVLTSRAFDLPAERVEDGVRVLRVPVLGRRRYAAASFVSMFTYLSSGAARARVLLRRERFDVVNTHFALPTGPLGHRLAASLKVPHVLSVQGGDLYDPSKWSSPHRHALLRLCVRRLALRADAVVASSADTLANLRNFYTRDAREVVIPLGIPRPPAVEGSRSRYGFSPDDVLLITVGRLVSRKAVDQLIDVVADLGDLRLKLVVVGSGPLEESLRAHAAARGVADRVRFAGRVSDEDKFGLLSVSDLYVSTSQHEGFGLVFLEAMAAGLPIVCYDRGGQIDFLETGETGAVVALNDRSAFVEQCRRLVTSPDRLAAAGATNRRRVKRYFIDHCAGAYEALFESLVEEGR